jgi:hypothetical protein
MNPQLGKPAAADKLSTASKWWSMAINFSKAITFIKRLIFWPIKYVNIKMLYIIKKISQVRYEHHAK